jgi:nucleotide-binding universal stress UspA family protein
LTGLLWNDKLIEPVQIAELKRRERGGAMFKNILIPTDGSEQSQRAVRFGIELAKAHGSRITGIHVIPDYHLLIAYEGAFDPVTEERIEEETKARADT